MTDKLDDFLNSILQQKQQVDILKKEILLHKGQKMIHSSKQAGWEYLVKRLASSEYQTENLYATLHVIDAIENEKNIEKSKNFLNEKEAFTKMIITHLVLYFSECGPEFYRQVVDYDLSVDEEIMLLQKEIKNERMKKEEKDKTKKLSK